MFYLSAFIFIPLIGALVIACFSEDNKRLILTTAAVFSFIPLVISMLMLFQFDQAYQAMQFVERVSWIPSLHVQYALGIDGMSLLLVILTSFISLIAVVSSSGISGRIKEYFFFFLLLETGIAGVFCALDFFLFYVFWNVTLISLYFLIGIWGGEQRTRAALRFLMFGLTGSAALFLCMLGVYFFSDPHTFDLIALAQHTVQISGFNAVVLFGTFIIGFGLLMPVFPFHTWFPFAQREAPLPVSIMLVAVVIKMGIYGMLRIAYPLLPGMVAPFSNILIILGLCNVVFGAMVALVQTDLKKIIAYISITHMGFCLLGIASVSVAGFSGAVFHLFNHGIFITALLLMIGILHSRTETYNCNEFGGIRIKVPVITGFTVIPVLAVIGIPGFSSFISTFLCFMGIFPRMTVAAVIGVLGILITAGYSLRIIERVFLGPLNEKWKSIPDMSANELVRLIPLILILIVFGIYPKPLLVILNETMVYLQQLMP